MTVWSIKIFALRQVWIPLVSAMGVFVLGIAFIVYKVAGFEQSSLGSVTPLEVPESFDQDGFLLSGEEGERRITITTDPMCPYCREFFEEHTEALTAMAVSGEWEVRLEVVSILDDPEVSDTVALTLSDVMSEESDSIDPLNLYLELTDSEFELVEKDPGEQIETQEAGEVAVVTVESAADEDVEWLRSISERNRQDVGSVPSGRVEGDYLTIDQLERLLTTGTH